MTYLYQQRETGAQAEIVLSMADLIPPTIDINGETYHRVFTPPQIIGCDGFTRHHDDHASAQWRREAERTF